MPWAGSKFLLKKYGKHLGGRVGSGETDYSLKLMKYLSEVDKTFINGIPLFHYTNLSILFYYSSY